MFSDQIMTPEDHQALLQVELNQLSMDPSVSGLVSSLMSSSSFMGDLDDHDSLHASPNEEFLNRHDKDRFLSISDFDRRFLKTKDVPGALHEMPIPAVTTREQLHGDERDMQGINWALRKQTRASVRSKRVALETSRLSPQVRAVREVC